MMKLLNFILSGVICVGLMSCGANPEQQKLVEDLKGISSDWTQVSSDLADLTTNLNETKTSWEKMYEGMSIEETQKAELDTSTVGQLDSLKTVCQGHGATYDQLITQATDLQTKRDEADAKLQELTKTLQGGESVASGNQVFEEVKTTLEELQKGIEEIKTSITSTKETCAGTCEAYANLADPKSAETEE